MAITKKNEIIARYNRQLEEAKREYRERKGLQIARGFSQSEEAKRIKKNRSNALYRYRISKLKAIDTPKEKLEKQGGKVSYPIVKRISNPEPWWRIISYGEMDDIGKLLSQGSRNLVIRVGGKEWANANAFRAKLSIQEASEAASEMQRKKYGGDSMQPQGVVTYFENEDGSETILVDIQ